MAKLEIGIEPIGKTAVYRLYDITDRLLYVGMTGTLRVRFRGHAADKWWWRDVARYEVTWFDQRADAEAEEARAILNDGPLYNVGLPHGRTPLRRPPGEKACGIVQATLNLGDLTDAAYYSGETTVITKKDRPRAAIVPCAMLEELEAYRARYGPLPTD